MSTISVHEAKAHFAALLRRVEAGETVTVTRHSQPVAEIRPLETRRRNVRLGAYQGEIEISEGAFAPLTDEELKDWYGE